MAASIKLILKRYFTNAMQVIDRFHIQKLTTETLQEIRIKYRWNAIEQKNSNVIETFENGDTRKQLLARSRYLLNKSREKWSGSQKQRAEILFAEYPDLKHTIV